MKRMVVAVLVAAGFPLAGRSTEPPALPTSPQVPMPTAIQQTTGMRTAGVGGRVLGPIRDRLSLGQPVNDVAIPPSQAWIAPVAESAPCAVPGGDCGTPVIAGSPIKSWLFFRPSTGHELPWLRPHPYVGPITGQFHCSPRACPECVGAPACASGGCGKGLGLGRGCRNGTCIPPADEVFGGYKFAAPLAPAITGRPSAPVTSTSYKPGVAPTGLSAPAPRNPTVLDSLKRNFSKP